MVAIKRVNKRSKRSGRTPLNRRVLRSRVSLKSAAATAITLTFLGLPGCAKHLTRFENKVARNIAEVAVEKTVGKDKGALGPEMTERLMDKIAEQVVAKFMAAQGNSNLDINMDDMKSEVVKAIARETLDRFLGKRKDKGMVRRRAEPLPVQDRAATRPKWPDYFGWKRTSTVGSARIRLITMVARQTGLSPEEVLLSAISNGLSEAHLKVRKMRLKGASEAKRREIKKDVKVLTVLLEMRKSEPELVNGAVNSARSTLFVKGKLLQDLKRRLQSAISKNLQKAVTSQN